MGKIDKEIFNKAIPRYIADSNINIPRLLEYTKKIRVKYKLKTFICV